MRKIMFLVLLLGLVIGCLIPEMVFGQRKKKPEITWKQEIYPGISVNDKYLFYNSEEIRVRASFEKEYCIPNEDGSFNRFDSVFYISITIPIYTAGRFVDVKKDGEKIKAMHIEFLTDCIDIASRDEKDNSKGNYRFIFLLAQDGSLVLKSKVNVVFKGKNYPIDAISSNSCKLLIFDNKSIFIKTVSKEAKSFNFQTE